MVIAALADRMISRPFVSLEPSCRRRLDDKSRSGQSRSSASLASVLMLKLHHCMGLAGIDHINRHAQAAQLTRQPGTWFPPPKQSAPGKGCASSAHANNASAPMFFLEPNGPSLFFMQNGLFLRYVKSNILSHGHSPDLVYGAQPRPRIIGSGEWPPELRYVWRRNNPPLKRPVDPAVADQNGTAYQPSVRVALTGRRGDVSGGERTRGSGGRVVSRDEHPRGHRRVFGVAQDGPKMLSFSVPDGYRRGKPPRRPKLGPFTGIIDRIFDRTSHRKQRHTASGSSTASGTSTVSRAATPS